MQAKHVVGTLTVGLSLLALTTLPAQAQTTLGVRGGVSVSSVDLDLGETFDDSNRTGFEGGVFLDFGRSSPLGFQIGAQYAQKGAELEFGDVVEDLSLNYLEIPAVVKLGIPLGGLKPSVLGGVAMGFNTGCEGFGRDDCSENITSTNFSGLLGADVVIDLGGLSLWADGRFHFGLNDIADAVEVDELKTRAWALQAGLGFPLGG
jgi:hypothetical protein